MTCWFSLVGSVLFRGPGIVASAAQDAQDDSVERVDRDVDVFFGASGRTRAPMRSAFQGFSKTQFFACGALSFARNDTVVWQHDAQG